MSKTLPQQTKFIILARYRSGSNLLAESLNLVPEVKVLSEIFNLANIVANPRMYLDPDCVMKKFDIHREAVVKAVGFKLMYGQTSRDELIESSWGPNISTLIKNQIEQVNAWLIREQLSVNSFEHLLDQVKRDTEIRIIHLVRSNQLESYVSFQLALKEDNWIGAAYKTGQNGLHVHQEDLEWYFRKGEAFSDYYAKLFQQHEMVQITYHDLSTWYAKTLREVLDFLNLGTAENLIPPISKQNTLKISEVISNYDAIYSYFKDTRWGGYFT